MSRLPALPFLAAALCALSISRPASASEDLGRADAEDPVAADDGEPGPSSKTWKAALVAGFGSSFDAAGLALEVRRGHWAGFLSLGADAFGAPPDGGPRGHSQGSLAGGVRWFYGDGDGVVLSLHALGTAWDGWQTHAVGQQGHFLLGATAGYRQRLGDRFFAQLAAGPAGTWERYDVKAATAQPVAGFRLGLDLDLGLGMSF